MDDKLKVSWDTSILRLVGERLKSEVPSEYENYIKLDSKGKLEYIKKNANILDVGYDKKLLEDVADILHPLLEKVITEEVSKEIVENYFHRFDAAMHNIFEFRIVLEKYANSIKPRSFEEESRLDIPYYLMIVESKFTADVNLLICLLIKSNVKYYRTRSDGKKEYVTINDLKKIDEETLYNKLTFLKENGFSVISDVCDRDLRNSIAHMGFIVFENGSVAYENKAIRKVTIITKDDLDTKTEKLLNVCHCITESIKQFYGQKYGFTRELSKLE